MSRQPRHTNSPQTVIMTSSHCRRSHVPQGLAIEKQAKTAEYDQSTAADAIATFTDFMTLYPDDPRVKDAQNIIDQLKAGAGARAILRLHGITTSGNNGWVPRFITTRWSAKTRILPTRTSAFNASRNSMN